jgi:hypothetical protein
MLHNNISGGIRKARRGKKRRRKEEKEGGRGGKNRKGKAIEKERDKFWWGFFLRGGCF